MSFTVLQCVNKDIIYYNYVDRCYDVHCLTCHTIAQRHN